MPVPRFDNIGTRFESIGNELFYGHDRTCCFLEAPTGWGKTRGCIDWIQKKNGRFLMIFPTRCCIKDLPYYPNIIYHTAYQGMKRLVHDWDVLDCVIIDECHYLIKEYELLFRILKYLLQYRKKWIRILMMSATLNEERLQTFFDEKDTHIVRVPTPSNMYQITTEYFYEAQYPSHDGAAYPNIYTKVNPHFADASEDLLDYWKEHSDKYNRVLCFVASSEQCEKLRSKLQKMDTSKRFHYICYYGQMNTEDQEKADALIHSSSHYRLFIVCTNIFESAVTIRGVDLVIDFGIQYFWNGRYLEMTFCDRWNMIQRSGRTGRTNHGKVIRMMNQAFFDEQEMQTIPIFETDWAQFFCQTMSLPENLIFDEQEINSFQEKVRNWQLLEKGTPSQYIQSPFGIRSTAILLELKTRRNRPEHILYVLAIAIIDCVETTGRSIVFYLNQNNNGKSKQKVYSTLRASFGSEEELIVWMNIFLTLYLQNEKEQKIQLSNHFSLNFKTFRAIQKTFTSGLKFIMSSCHDINLFMDKLSEFTEKDQRIISIRPYNIYRVKPYYKERLRGFFFHDCRMTPKLTDYFLRDESKMFVIRREIANFSKLNDTQSVPVWFTPVSYIDQYDYSVLQLWLYGPQYIEHFYNKLDDELEKMLLEREEKMTWKKHFSKTVVRFIDYVLSFAPYMKNW